MECYEVVLDEKGPESSDESQKTGAEEEGHAFS